MRGKIIGYLADFSKDDIDLSEFDEIRFGDPMTTGVGIRWKDGEVEVYTTGFETLRILPKAGNLIVVGPNKRV